MNLRDSMPTREQAEHLVKYLSEHGIIGIELIGSLTKKKKSSHDIDLYIPNADNFLQLLERLLAPTHVTMKTDIGSIYYHGSLIAGSDVDIFPYDPRKKHVKKGIP